MMRRRPDWVERLTVYLDGARSLPFDPVHFNCCLFVARAMNEVVEGVPERMKEIGVGEEATDTDVARTLIRFGGVRGIFTAYAGAEPDAAVLCARRGDIVVADGHIFIDGSPDRETLGVVDSAGFLAVTPDGLKHFPMTLAKGYWKV